jgi:hypothetical protein
MALIPTEEIPQYAEINLELYEATTIEIRGEEQSLAIMIFNKKQKRMIRQTNQAAVKYEEAKKESAKDKDGYVPWDKLLLMFKAEAAYSNCWISLIHGLSSQIEIHPELGEFLGRHRLNLRVTSKSLAVNVVPGETKHSYGYKRISFLRDYAEIFGRESLPANLLNELAESELEDPYKNDKGA